MLESVSINKDDDAKPLVEAVYEALLEAVLAGKITSGTILSEVAVAKQLDVSRTPVHDALRQLAKDGIVERESGRRARVADFTPDDVYEVFELRKLLEGHAAYLSASRMDLRHLAPLDDELTQLRQTTQSDDWIARWTDHDDSFHTTIAEASGNRRLAHDIARYRLIHRGINRTGSDTESLQKALQQHVEILDALRLKDADRARQTMIDHIEYWQAFFVRTFRR